MGYNVNFAGQDLSQYCKILNVQRSVLPPRTNYSKSIPSMNGSQYTGYHYGERTVTLEIVINKDKGKTEYLNNIKNLASLLDVKNPSKLYIDDEPDKYYYAILDGETDISQEVLAGTAEITFICFDPLLYSDTWKTFGASADNVISIKNEGTANAKMIMDIDFNNDACFFQSTNNLGETVLVGQPRKITNDTISVTDILVNDDCTTTTTMTSLSSSLLDSGREVTGNFGVDGGDGIICTNYGTSADNKWTGVSFKRNLGANISEFEVSIDFIFTSNGKNYVKPVEPTKPVTPPPSSPSVTVPSTSLGTYKVVNCGGLWINKDANTSTPLYAMAPGTYIYPTEFSGNWAKHTHSNKWNTFTGWSSMKYLQKISDKKITKDSSISTYADEYAEDQIGLLEVYGFDQNGAKLFKMEVSDTNEYYEYVDPVIYVGTTKILDDGKNTPTPRKVTTKDSSNKEVTTEAASGVFGDWNDIDGKLVIKREKNSNGDFLWSAYVYKYENGKVIRTMSTVNSLVSSSYPKGQLNYLGFYIGRYGSNTPVDLIKIKNISVRRLNLLTDIPVLDNQIIFKAGDHLQLDFENGQVYLNGKDYLTNLDIGSEFFDIPPGEHQIAILSDDRNIAVCSGIQERFI